MRFVTMIAVASTILATAFGVVAYVQHLDAAMYREQSARDRAELNTVLHKSMEKDKLIADLQAGKEKAGREADEAEASAAESRANAVSENYGDQGILETAMNFSSFGIFHMPNMSSAKEK